MLALLGWVVLGLIAGAIAKMIMPGRDPGGLGVTLLLGIVGSLLGGLIGRLILGTDPRAAGADPGVFLSLVLAVIGSTILLAIYRVYKKRHVHRQRPAM